MSLAVQTPVSVIDAAIARAKALEPVPAPTPPPSIPACPAEQALHPGAVIGRVAAAYFVTVDQVLRKDRHRSIAQARHVACWAMRRLCNLSYPQIGSWVGARDHTTILSAVRKVEARRSTEPAFAAFTDLLLAQLREAPSDG